MATYRYVVNDLLQAFQQVEATSKITQAHVFFWVQTIANRLRKKSIEKNYGSGDLLNIFTGIPVLKQVASTNPNVVKGRKYFVLPRAIYDYRNEKGINYVSYEFSDDSIGFTKIFFQPTAPSVSHRLYYSPYEKPSSRNPYFYRVHDNIYLLGVDDVTVKTVEVGLYSVLDSRINLINIDDTLDIDEEQISILRYEVLNLGRFALMMPQDRRNDGADTTITQGKPTAITAPKAESESQ